jgi:hypothetical protein
VTTPADQHPALADRIADALSEAGAFCGECGFEPGETGCPDCIRVREVYTAELLAVVQPELDARDAEIDRLTAGRNRYRNAWNNARSRAQDHAADNAMWRRIVTGTEQARDRALEDITRLTTVAQSAAVLLRAAADRHPADAGTYRTAAQALDDTATTGQQATPCADCGLPHAADGWPAEVCRRVRAYGGVYAGSKPDPVAPDCGCQTDAHPGHYPTCPTTATTGT